MIRQLDENTIQKIAAGEVIERPESIVKELVENSIDAGATQIAVAIENGGKDLIRVSDNGEGISSDEFLLAFSRHATSKIADFEDLYRVTSMGFRGEALASVVAVAKVTARSRTEDAKLGREVTFREGKVKEEKSVAMQRGTQLEVRDLFYNVPVRRKFLKTDTTEANRITQLMYRLALGNPDIAFRYEKDGRHIFQTRGIGVHEENILLLFGQELVDSLVAIDAQSEHFTISGHISNNIYYRGNRQLEFFYMNGRYIEDDRLRDVVESCYRSIIPNGRFPAFQIFFAADPSLLEVNVHPNKQRIKISKMEELEDLLMRTVRDALLAKPKAPGLPVTQEKKQRDFSEPTDYQKIIDRYRWQDTDGEKASVFRESAPVESAYPLLELYMDTEEEEDDEIEQRQEIISEVMPEKENTITYLGSIFKTYLIFQKGESDTVIIADQHAAHERIHFERFMKQWNTDMVIAQELLIPRSLQLTPMQMTQLGERSDLLRRFGFDFSFFGDKQVRLHSMPILFDQPENEQMFLDLLDIEVKEISDLDTHVRRIATKACKASVKQGDILTEQEALTLYADLLQCEFPFTCPHGRPTMVEWTKGDFEKLFARRK